MRAPAGFGKTTLLVDLAHEAPGGVCWLSLDEWDRDPATFLQYLRLSVSRRFGARAAGRGQRAPKAEPRAVLSEIAARIDRSPEETWIFLDDFHYLGGSGEVEAAVDYLTRWLPSNCRLVLASRVHPALPSLPRLRLDGKVLEVGPSDMSFTADEIRHYYLSVRKETISSDQAERLLRLTQGWPAAVALAKDIDRSAQDETGPSLQASEYLAAEIFERLPEALRQLLLWSSVFDAVEADGCDQILGRDDSARQLRALEQHNVPLMRVDGAAPSYRVNPLLRDFLRAKLRSESPDLYRALNQKAASWQAGRGRTSEAIWHSSQAGDWESVEALVREEAPRAYRGGRWQTVTSWLEMVPGDELRKRKPLRLWEARVLARLGQADHALQVVSESVDGLTEAQSALLAEFETIRSTALRLKGELAWSLASARRAVDLAITGNAPIDVLAEARKQLGLALAAQGSFEEAIKEFRGVLDISEQRGDLEESAFLSACLGSALGSLGRLSEAVPHLEKARRQWDRVGNSKELSWALNNLAMVYLLMGYTERGRELFSDALREARAGGLQRAEAYALVSLADLDRQGGEFRAALDRYEEAIALAAGLEEMALATHANSGLSYTYCEMGDLARAEALARQVLASAEERQSAYEQGLGRLALGKVSRRQGRVDEAIGAFSAAAALFDTVGARKEQAEALYHIADASLLAKRSRRIVRESLERLAALARGLGHDHFLVQVVVQAPAAAQYGVSKRIGAAFYRELLQRTAPRRPPTAERRGVHVADSGLPVVEVVALGEFAVRMNGRLVMDYEWESEKSKELLLLLLSQERSLRRDEIVAALWPESAGARAISGFHSCLYRVRHALYSESIVESGRAYCLNPAGSFEYDVQEFERLVARARGSGEEPAGEDALRRAVDLYNGPFAPGIESEWVQTRRLRLEDRFLDAAAKLADKLLDQREFRGAAEACKRLLEYDPYNEAACHKLMRACALAGDQEAALIAYRRFSEALEADLGERPAEGLTRLYAAIRKRIGRTANSPP
ncbi:MAG TPA: BTAD domain-containing putative transcriptional regulator [Dehalococcoidia bacterium]|nr:BTAD domain-containing putative transcriptional regulator [Dehalococcoidia bacterium]